MIFSLIVSLILVLQGKGMLLVLQDRMLTLVDPDDRSLLHSQPISSIRVWGVGRDHDRLVDAAQISSRELLCCRRCWCCRVNVPNVEFQ